MTQQRTLWANATTGAMHCAQLTTLLSLHILDTARHSGHTVGMVPCWSSMSCGCACGASAPSGVMCRAGALERCPGAAIARGE